MSDRITDDYRGVFWSSGLFPDNIILHYMLFDEFSNGFSFQCVRFNSRLPKSIWYIRLSLSE